MLLKYDLVQDKGKTFLGTIINESNRLNQLIQSFLDIAYIESGRHKITKSDFEVGPMLKDLIGTVGPMAAGKQIAVQSAGADGIRVHADRLLIYQALINLVANAIKYSPAGTMVRIGVSDGNGGVRFEVADQGGGIPADELWKICEKFYRRDDGGNREDPGLHLLERMKCVNADAEVVIMTAHGSMETAVHAVHNGAFDYISKPFVVDEMLRILHRIEEKFQLSRSKTVGPELAENLPKTEIIGATPKMVDIYKKVAKTARIEAPVLVIGESGSGKELIARALHENSARAKAPFVVINCGALPETLLESELYGHERGSFTGATGSRKGLFESAAGGTAFLDEISETSLSFQVKLLRVIQEREIRRVGSNDTIQVDVRLIAATNRDLREMVRTGQFREDLFHRLNVFTIALPPLRDRRGDIPLLSSFFLKLFTEKNGKTVRLSEDALEAMKQYSWPGNVRELKN